MRRAYATRECHIELIIQLDLFIDTLFIWWFHLRGGAAHTLEEVGPRIAS
jgi:hypothetical protein